MILIFFLFGVISADKLIQVQILWRHGARTPLHCNWNCEEFTQKKMMNGFLTPTGMRQHYVLGDWLRKRYIDSGFLNASFTESEIYIQSTDVNRTIMSGQSNLLGMFPLGTGSRFVDSPYTYPPNQGNYSAFDNYGLPNGLQVFPIHVIEKRNDQILRGYTPLVCPKLSSIQKDNDNSEDYASLNKSNQALIEQFAKELNTTDVNLTILSRYQDTFDSCIYNGYPMPTLTNNTEEQLKKIQLLISVVSLFRTWEQVRYTSAPFVNNLLNAFNDNKKYIVYSAHDTTIMQIALALNWTSFECLKNVFYNITNDQECISEYPAYASNIIFELYERNDHSRFVRILYNGQQMKTMGSLDIEYEQFKSVLSYQANVSYADYCQTSYQLVKVSLQQQVIIVVLLCLLAILLVTCLRLLRKFRRSQIQSSVEEFQLTSIMNK